VEVLRKGNWPVKRIPSDERFPLWKIELGGGQYRYGIIADVNPPKHKRVGLIRTEGGDLRITKAEGSQLERNEFIGVFSGVGRNEDGSTALGTIRAMTTGRSKIRVISRGINRAADGKRWYELLLLFKINCGVVLLRFPGDTWRDNVCLVDRNGDHLLFTKKQAGFLDIPLDVLHILESGGGRDLGETPISDDVEGPIYESRSKRFAFTYPF